MTNKQMIAAALQEIADAHSGRITPDLVVAEAKKKDSPLHAYFEWDVKKAAAKYWLDQARVLIQTVRLEVTTEQLVYRVPAYVRDPEQPGDKQGYTAFSRLRSDVDLARESVVNEFARAGSALRRARDLAGALGVQERVEEVEQQVRELTEIVQAQAA